MAVQHDRPAAAESERRSQADRRSEAESALLDAAMRLFARRGVDATSLADIGAEAGRSRGLANHHFGSRAALVEQLARRGQRRFVRHVEDHGPAPDGLTAIVELAVTYLALFEDPSDEVRAFFVMRGSAIPTDAPLRDVYAVDDRKFRRGIESLVESGRRDGSIRADADAPAFAVALIGMLRGIGSQRLIAPDAVDLDAARTMCSAFITCALAGDPTAGDD